MTCNFLPASPQVVRTLLSTRPTVNAPSDLYTKDKFIFQWESFSQAIKGPHEDAILEHSLKYSMSVKEYNPQGCYDPHAYPQWTGKHQVVGRVEWSTKEFTIPEEVRPILLHEFEEPRPYNIQPPTYKFDTLNNYVMKIADQLTTTDASQRSRGFELWFAASADLRQLNRLKHWEKMFYHPFSMADRYYPVWMKYVSLPSFQFGNGNQNVILKEVFEKFWKAKGDKGEYRESPYPFVPLVKMRLFSP